MPATPPVPAAGPDPATAAAETQVKAALAELGAGPRPSTEHIRAMLAGAGFQPETIEVTASRTPTGLAADAVEAAVRQDQDCVVAQLRNGAVAVTVLPVLAGGHCLAGPRA